MKERESERKETDDNVSNELRLNKYIANTGLCSRRAADKLIEEGRVKVNGKVNIELGTKVTLNDKVVVDGNLLSTGERFYILINKPRNVICTTKDEKGRNLCLIKRKNSKS